MGTSVEITANNIWWTGTKERREEQRRGKKWMKSCWLLKVISLNSFFFPHFYSYPRQKYAHCKNITLGCNIHVCKCFYLRLLKFNDGNSIYMGISKENIFRYFYCYTNQIMQELPNKCWKNKINVIQISIYIIRIKPW